MNVKTLTGPSIHATLIEARKLFGDDVVLLESSPPQGSQPAQITIMTDQPLPRPANKAVTPLSLKEPAPAMRTAVAPQSQPAPEPVLVATASPGQAFGYAATRPRPKATPSAVSHPQEDIRLKEQPAPFNAGFSRHALISPQGDGSTAMPAPRSGVRGALFAPEAGTTPPPPPPKPDWKPMENFIETRFGHVLDRIEQLEHRLSDAVIGASNRWVAHPLYSHLLARGMRPATTTRLFENLSEKGFHADTDENQLRWALAQELRRLLETTAPKRTIGTQLFIGPSGAGKTSLLLKLAKSPDFYGLRRPTVITIQPEDISSVPYQDPTALFRRFDLSVQNVKTPEEMYHALSRARRFDHILIDTPSLPLEEAAARKMLLRIKKMVDAIMPLQVQFVLNATRILEPYTHDYLQKLPLHPNAVAFTHLDETEGWGRVVEWMLALRMPVQFVSVGTGIDDGPHAYSPSWFAEEMMDL